jgi:Serine/threonine protein kinase
MVETGGWSELSDGDEFAGYRIERRLGRGGMGILYLAVEPGLDRQVALKLIAPEAAVDDVFAKRFAEESRIAASIEHPNVVPIYAAGEERGVPYIAMRFVSGSDLGRRIARDGRLEPALAVALIAQIGSGLDAIHAARRPAWSTATSSPPTCCSAGRRGPTMPTSPTSASPATSPPSPG